MNAVFPPWLIREFRDRSDGIPESGREDSILRGAGAFFGRSHICTLRTTAASINFYLYPGPPATKARIVLREWNVLFSVPPARQGIFLKNPEPLNEREFYFDYQGSRGGWCWRNEDGGTFLTTPELADHILKLMIDLHDRVEKKRMSARDDPWAEEDDD